MSPALWGPFAVVLAGLLGLYGSKLLADRSRAGDERTAEIQANAGIASGYSLLTSDLRTELTRKDAERRRDIDDLRKRSNEDRARITDLEGRLDRIGRRYREAVSYIRVLRAFITDNVQGHEPPPMPDDLTLDLD